MIKPLREKSEYCFVLNCIKNDVLNDKIHLHNKTLRFLHIYLLAITGQIGGPN